MILVWCWRQRKIGLIPDGRIIDCFAVLFYLYTVRIINSYLIKFQTIVSLFHFH